MISNAQITELFMKRLNCAAHRIAHMQRVMTCEIVSNYSLPGLSQTKSTMYPTWVLERKPCSIHPFSILLHGRPCRTALPIVDLETYLNLPGGLATFRQGFLNVARNKDCWTGYPESHLYYYHSLYFNLGRAFLNKFVGANLPYTLPTTYQKLFTSLK